MKRPFRPFSPKPGHCASVSTAAQFVVRLGSRDRCAYYGLTVNETRSVTQLALRVLARERSTWRALAAAQAEAFRLNRNGRGAYRYGDDHPRSA